MNYWYTHNMDESQNIYVEWQNPDKQKDTYYMILFT